MAGIGFELRKFLKEETFLGLIRAYGYAGLIGSGPWVLSILGIMAIGLLSAGTLTPTHRVLEFLVSVAYLMAVSLITGSWLQLMLTRFIADRLFEKSPQRILPNLLGTLFVISALNLLIGVGLSPLFAGQSFAYCFLMVANLITLGNIWVVVILLSGVRAHQRILRGFFIGYSATLLMALSFQIYGLVGLLSGLLAGHGLLFFFLLAAVIREYPSDQPIAFDFLDARQSFYSLAFTSFFYSLGIWADKFAFWINPATSETVIGPLRSSFIYDPPAFLAYLSLIPGMAVFLLRMEADFVDRYDAFYTAVREGGTLDQIRELKAKMIETIRQGLYEIFKVQGLTAIILIVARDTFMQTFGLSSVHGDLFVILIIAVSVHVLLLAILNVFFYLDKRRVALTLTLIFALGNIGLTLVSQQLGPAFYGYGVAIAVTLTSVVGLVVLNRKLQCLEYETFMLQRQPDHPAPPLAGSGQERAHR